MLPLPTFPSHSAGYYMFIEASRPRVTGDKARLISPLYNISAKYYCVSFYYHMYGKHIGECPWGRVNSASRGLLGSISNLLPQQLCLQPAIPEGGSPTPVFQAAGGAAELKYLSRSPAVSEL